MALPLGSPSGAFTRLGNTASTSFNHAGIGVSDVNIKYRVAAVTEQAAEFGAVLQQGAWANTTLFFGTAPAFAPGTPADGSLFIASKQHPLLIPLFATTPDLPAVSVSFRTTGSAPAALQFTPPVPAVDVASKTVAQNVSMVYEEALAGTELVLCFQGEDSNGLRTATRCYTLLVPRPAPRLLAPSNESAYQATVGCALDVVFQADDRTSADLEPAVAAASGFAPAVLLLSVLASSAYSQRSSSQLPAGATLETEEAPPGAVSNPATSVIRWIPRKGQEGFSYR